MTSMARPWFIVATFAMILTAQVENAQAYTWSGGVGDWHDAASWGGSEPTAGDVARIVADGDEVTVSQAGEVASYVEIDRGGHLSVVSGSLDAGSSLRLVGNEIIGGSHSYPEPSATVSGGAVTTDSMVISVGGNGSWGRVTQTGGSIVATSGGDAVQAFYNGIFDISGGYIHLPTGRYTARAGEGEEDNGNGGEGGEFIVTGDFDSDAPVGHCSIEFNRMQLGYLDGEMLLDFNWVSGLSAIHLTGSGSVLDLNAKVVLDLAFSGTMPSNGDLIGLIVMDNDNASMNNGKESQLFDSTLTPYTPASNFFVDGLELQLRYDMDIEQGLTTGGNDIGLLVVSGGGTAGPPSGGATPEPSSLVLGGLALAFLALAGVRKGVLRP